LVKSSPKSSPKTGERIIELIRQDPYTTTETMGEILGITKRAVLNRLISLRPSNVFAALV
jgi:predicted ArsR family transcriptional regulator